MLWDPEKMLLFLRFLSLHIFVHITYPFALVRLRWSECSNLCRYLTHQLLVDTLNNNLGLAPDLLEPLHT